MKKIFFALLFLLVGLSAFAADAPTVPVPPSTGGVLDAVVLNTSIVRAIFKGVKAFKKLLESKYLVWILKLTGHSEVMPFLSVALTICGGLVAGITLYGLDGLTSRELWKLGLDVLIANGVHIFSKELKAKVPPAVNVVP